MVEHGIGAEGLTGTGTGAPIQAGEGGGWWLLRVKNIAGALRTSRNRGLQTISCIQWEGLSPTQKHRTLLYTTCVRWVLPVQAGSRRRPVRLEVLQGCMEPGEVVDLGQEGCPAPGKRRSQSAEAWQGLLGRMDRDKTAAELK